MADGMDLTLIASVITDRPLCADCIRRTAGMTRWQVNDAVLALKKTIRIATSVAQCEGCLQTRVVHRLL